MFLQPCSIIVLGVYCSLHTIYMHTQLIPDRFCCDVELFIPTHFKSVTHCKVEKILKGSLDLISSPSSSVKIQIMGGKVYLRCRGKTLLGVVNKLLKTKFVDTIQQCLACLPQVNFPTNNLNFHWRWRWWNRIQAIILNLFYFIWMLPYLAVHFLRIVKTSFCMVIRYHSRIF